MGKRIMLVVVGGNRSLAACWFVLGAGNGLSLEERYWVGDSPIGSGPPSHPS